MPLSNCITTIVVVVVVVGISIGNQIMLSSAITEAESQSLLAIKDCKRAIAEINSLESFRSFVSQFLTSSYQLNEDGFNRCVKSTNGLEDIRSLEDIVSQVGSVHSVCEPEFIDNLIKFHHQIKVKHVRHGKMIGLKKTNRLTKFFQLIATQVIITCKQSLESKLIMVENQDQQLVDSINLINDKLTKIERLQKSANQRLVLPPKLPIILRMVMKFKPKTLDRVESLLLLDSIKPNPQSDLSLSLTLNSRQNLEQFLKTKEACKRIDMYAQSSMYPIARLAWKGYIARKGSLINGQPTGDSLDQKLEQSQLVKKWIKLAQFCQGVLLSRAYLDVEQELPVKLQDEVDADSQIVTINLEEAQAGHRCPVAPKQQQQQQQQQECPSGRFYRFEQVRDRFNEIDEQLQHHQTQHKSLGLKAWLSKRFDISDQLMAKYIRLGAYDQAYTQSFIENNSNDDATLNSNGVPEKDVAFASLTKKGGAFSGAHGGHHAAAGHGSGGHASSHATHATHHGHTKYYIFFSHPVPGWEGGLAIAGMIMGIMVAVVLVIGVAFACVNADA